MALPRHYTDRLQRLRGCNPEDVPAMLAFVRHRYRVDSLLDVPLPVAKEIVRRPYDFVQAAKNFYQPELFG